MQTQVEPVSDRELAEIFKRSERLHDLSQNALVVLAVSGGADSMALLHLYKRFLELEKNSESRAMRQALVVTVDHDLRPGSADEAEWVAAYARARGFEHVILKWTGEKPTTGIQEAARKARYNLMRSLSQQRGNPQTIIVTGHHQDDQAETLLMRLARGSGLDGLCAMRKEAPLPQPDAPDLNTAMLWRPLLAIPKSRLMATLKAAGVTWRDDPSNNNQAFERVRLRQSKSALDDLGLTSPRLALSAKRLLRAQDALSQIAQNHFEAAVKPFDGAYGQVSFEDYTIWPDDIRLRVLALLLRAFGGRGEIPNMAQLEDLTSALAGTGETKSGSTLGGCVVSHAEGHIIVYREPGRQALPSLQIEPGGSAVWDHRFVVELSHRAKSPVEISSLGEERYRELCDHGLIATKMPSVAASGLPVFVRAGRVVSAPHLGYRDAQDPESGIMTLRFAW